MVLGCFLKARLAPVGAEDVMMDAVICGVCHGSAGFYSDRLDAIVVAVCPAQALRCSMESLSPRSKSECTAQTV